LPQQQTNFNSAFQDIFASELEDNILDDNRTIVSAFKDILDSNNVMDADKDEVQADNWDNDIQSGLASSSKASHTSRQISNLEHKNFCLKLRENVSSSNGILSIAQQAEM
jgi:hypothetical protein